MNFNIFDNDVACLIISSDIENIKLDIVKSYDNKVYFRFSLSNENYKEAIELINQYEEEEIQIDLKKYNYNRKRLLKEISIIKAQ